MGPNATGEASPQGQAGRASNKLAVERERLTDGKKERKQSYYVLDISSCGVPFRLQLSEALPKVLPPNISDD